MASLRVTRTAVLIACACSVHVSPARAQSPKAEPSANEQRAVTLFEQAVSAYRAGDFAKSVDLLQQAYALKPAPVLLYNLARAYEGMGKLEDAARAYREYLAKEPKPDDRGAIEKRVATLDAQVAERERLRREKEEESARAARASAMRAEPKPASPTTAPNVAPWIVAGVGGAAVLAGGALMIVAKGTHDDATSEPVQRKADALAQDASAMSTTASIVMLSGAAVLATGIVWALVAPRRTVSSEVARQGLPLRITW